MTELEAFLAQLSREPDFDAPELQAFDAADLLLLEAAFGYGDGDGSLTARALDHGLVVIGDRHGALTLGAAHITGVNRIRVYQDGVLAERALLANAARLRQSVGADHHATVEHHPLAESLLSGAKLVIMQLPKSLAELEEIAWRIARWADADVTVLAGGRDKHMSKSMNEVLEKYFESVQANRGWRKSRVLTATKARQHASDELARTPPFPVSARDPELSFDLYAFGATFGGASFDHGSRLLLQTLLDQPPQAEPRHIVDLGCGNGVLSTAAALRWPHARVIATDQSAAAVAATKLTAEAAGVLDRVEVHRTDATEAVEDGWADLVLLNPPFHTGSTVHAGVAHRLIQSCARALAPGAELRLVFNSHLGFRSFVERVIGPVEQIARDRTFTVLRASRRS